MTEELNALQAAIDHFADVMGGPLMRAAGVQFEGGVDNIPTIKAARKALAILREETDDPWCNFIEARRSECQFPFCRSTRCCANLK